MNTWGKHLYLDVANGDLDAVRSKEVISAFFAQLVIDIDMVAYGPLWIERFATHDETKSGYSAFQMIETSNLSGHFVDKDGSFYLDVFSCKDFDEEIVKSLVRKYFGDTVIFSNGGVIARDANIIIFEGANQPLDTFQQAVLNALKGQVIECKDVIIPGWKISS